MLICGFDGARRRGLQVGYKVLKWVWGATILTSNWGKQFRFWNLCDLNIYIAHLKFELGYGDDDDSMCHSWWLIGVLIWFMCISLCQLQVLEMHLSYICLIDEMLIDVYICMNHMYVYGYLVCWIDFM